MYLCAYNAIRVFLSSLPSRTQHLNLAALFAIKLEEETLERNHWKRNQMEKIKIGKIVNAVALRGEVKIYNYSDYKERYEELERLLIEDNKGNKASNRKEDIDNFKEYQIENVRYQKEMVIIKFKGVNDRNQAEELKEKDVYITEEDLRILPEDTFYIRDLIGCRVFDMTTGKNIGEIKDVLQNTAQDLYQVELTGGGQTLIPAVEQFVTDVNIKEKLVTVKLIPGFIDDAIEC